MSDKNITRCTLDLQPKVSQKLDLLCVKCGRKGRYDVGTIYLDQKGSGTGSKYDYSFTGYFRCAGCNSGGPWEIVDFLELTAHLLRETQQGKVEGIIMGQMRLFDGTVSLSSANGEDHLLELVRKDPRNAFLHTRLGNLLRACDKIPEATTWYEKSLALDPEDIEARYHLFNFARAAGEMGEAARHLTQLVRLLLQGRRTNSDELTEGLAYSVAENLRDASASLQNLLLGATSGCNSKEGIFIRTLLAEEGPEDDICRHAMDRLLKGIVTPENVVNKSDTTSNFQGPVLNFLPSLDEFVVNAELKRRGLTVPLQTDTRSRITLPERPGVAISDGAKVAVWTAPPLREMFRGDRIPPPDLDHYPPAYAPHFYFIEHHLLMLCDVIGNRTDQEMEEIYSAFRRRPDGKCQGETHAYLWQVVAVWLATRVVSAAEFEAIFRTLAKSAGKFGMRPVSRNYVNYLRDVLRQT